MKITNEIIELASRRVVCREALIWMRAAERTWEELIAYNKSWGEWAATDLPLPEAEAELLERLGCGRSWWVNDLRHREGDLPAVECADGSREWWVNDLRHREGGLPACEWADGSRSWWVNGCFIRKEAVHENPELVKG